MTNAPIILTQDCDMYSNDPQTPLRVLCYLMDPSAPSTLGFVQFPQRFHGIHKDDIYGTEYKIIIQVFYLGFNGLIGPYYMGTGCFFRRRVFFGGPTTLVPTEIPQLYPDHVANKPVRSQATLALAYRVAARNYENQTKWGSKIGFRYGTVAEDLYTGLRLHCEGWKSIFCDPDRPAFLGDAPITLSDALTQCKRWFIGLYQSGFCKHSPLTFGIRRMGLLMGLAYSHIAFWAIFFLPITVYALLPQLAHLNSVSVFPEISEPWIIIYVFLFLGAFGQDFLDFVLAGGTVRGWWNAQRMWLIRGLSCNLFATAECLLKSLGISAHEFGLTSKVIHDEQSKRHELGVFEFGVPSPMFVPITTAAMINLLSFICGAIGVVPGSSNKEALFLQALLSGLIAFSFLPIYQAIALAPHE